MSNCYKNEMADFSFVLPSYNGGAYFKECVRGIQAQTRDDWQLEVLDDCSSDDSLGWLARLNDSRISVYPSSERLGIERNWARALEIPLNPWMTIIAQDDSLDPNYLEVMSDLIARHPDATLYQAHFRLIDKKGRVLRSCAPMPARETGAEFLAARLQEKRDSFGTGYMMRSAAYDALGGIAGFPKLLFADDALWISLMQNGWKATAPQECFSYRLHAASTSGSRGSLDYLKALAHFWRFLEPLKNRDEAIAQTLEEHLPHYVLNACRGYYMLVLQEASKRNEKIYPSAREVMNEMIEAIRYLHPQLAGEFAQALRHTRPLRLQEVINNNTLARALCSAGEKARAVTRHYAVTQRRAGKQAHPNEK